MFQKYIAEEIATDCAEGVLSRREALGRLTGLGLSAAAAAALIAACAPAGRQSAHESERAGVPATAASPSAPPPGAQDALAVEPIAFPGARGELLGAWSEAPNAQGAVLVIHENRGLTDHIKTIPGRLAGVGFSALAIDLLSEEGGTSAFASQDEATKALMAASSERFAEDLKSGLDELARREPGKKLAVMGFCFGGGLTWQLLLTKDPRVAVGAPFYGPLHEEGPPDALVDFRGSGAAVIAFYGEQDARVNASRAAAENSLKAAGLAHAIVVERNANHAFFNDTGPRYVPVAANDAWQQLVFWLKKYLA
ncbi:MAG: dienelactone hydrolase family protein [Segniliparus sp.]|uniref:dienelactone hydrolase family protein n=1 Tax=Segniliparus sp. TaxID=2804064 RepID=UPI003F385838